MNKKLILISGSPCVGKTAVGTRLFESYNNSAYLDGDWRWCVHPFSVAEPAVRDRKGMHTPAPVPVQIRAVVIVFKEPRTHGCFAHAGGTADEDQLFVHILPSISVSFSLHPFPR